MTYFNNGTARVVVPSFNGAFDVSLEPNPGHQGEPSVAMTVDGRPETAVLFKWSDLKKAFAMVSVAMEVKD